MVDGPDHQKGVRVRGRLVKRTISSLSARLRKKWLDFFAVDPDQPLDPGISVLSEGMTDCKPDASDRLVCENVKTRPGVHVILQLLQIGNATNGATSLSSARAEADSS